MNVYAPLLILLVICCLLNMNVSRHRVFSNGRALYVKRQYFLSKKSFNYRCGIFFACVLLFLIMFRSQTMGADTKVYISYFNELKHESFINRINISQYDKAYAVLVSIIAIFTKDTQIFVSILGTLCIIPYLIFIFKNSKDILLTFILFITIFMYYDTLFSVFRQSFSFGFILLSYEYVKKKKLIKYSILMIIAFLFHKTAIFFFPMYLIVRFPVNSKSLVFWISAMVIVGFATKFGLPILLPMYKMNNYTNNLGAGHGIGIFLEMICFAIISLLLFNSGANNKANRYALNLVFMALVIQTMMFHFEVMYRISNRYFFFILILLPNILFDTHDRYRKVAYVICICLAIFSLLWQAYFDNPEGFDFVFLWNQ